MGAVESLVGTHVTTGCVADSAPVSRGIPCPSHVLRAARHSTPGPGVALLGFDQEWPRRRHPGPLSFLEPETASVYFSGEQHSSEDKPATQAHSTSVPITLSPAKASHTTRVDTNETRKAFHFYRKKLVT